MSDLSLGCPHPSRFLMLILLVPTHSLGGFPFLRPVSWAHPSTSPGWNPTQISSIDLPWPLASGWSQEPNIKRGPCVRVFAYTHGVSYQVSSLLEMSLINSVSSLKSHGCFAFWPLHPASNPLCRSAKFPCFPVTEQCCWSVTNSISGEQSVCLTVTETVSMSSQALSIYSEQGHLPYRVSFN